MENDNILEGFSRKNSSILGFVIWCERSAITFDEFKEFFFQLVKKSDIESMPDFIWDILNMKEEDMLHIYRRIIGFVPDSEMTEKEIYALYGIGIKRFGSVFDMPIPKKKALDELNKNPQILEKFKRTFPFIELGF